MKNVIITGAANGVGKAVAQILKDENLILLDIDEENLIKTAKELNKEYYVCDISKSSDIDKIISNIKDTNIDCLINCAGMWISGDMSKLEQPIFDEMNTLDRIKNVIDTNVFGTIAMIKSVFPIMKNKVMDKLLILIHKVELCVSHLFQYIMLQSIVQMHLERQFKMTWQETISK